MELNEAVNTFNKAIENKEENYCNNSKHDPPQSGPNLIDGLTGTPTPENLLDNMKKHSKRNNGDPHIPKLPPKKEGREYWDIEKCDSDTFPWQTHHLIPKKFLPEQPVCVWLTEKYTKHKKYQLAKDTRYSTDHSNNGYCLPFVSTCDDWKIAKNPSEKSKAAELMMNKTQKQLHQGNHNYVDFEKDFDEKDENVEPEQYLESIKHLLKRIHVSASDHTDSCEECQKEGKRKIQPLHKIVDQVDLVSLITKLRINSHIIFVSQRAYEYFKPKN